MNVVKCTNNHFFDLDTYEKCPHCGAEVNLNTATNDTTVERTHKNRFFRSGKKETSSNSQYVQPSPKPEFSQIPMPESQPISEQVSVNPIQNSNTSKQSDHTLDFWEPTASNSKPVVQEEHTMDIYGVNSRSASESMIEKDESSEISAPDLIPNVETKADTKSEPVSLKEAIERSSASSGEKTVSYFNAVASEHKEERVSADPVVGWLVCINGKHFGESFNIYVGKNSIGRGESNRIILNRDNSISREKHAFIIYEPKKRNFYLQPGDSSGLTYLNDDYITESKILSIKDTIDLGDSKFTFIPLCDESFSWEEYISKE